MWSLCFLTNIQGLATSKDMSGETQGYQSEPQQSQPEQRTSVSTQLTAYIDGIETRPRERLAYLNKRGIEARQPLNGREPGELQKEIVRLEHMKQEVRQGNFSSIATELQTRRAEPEARLAELRPQLRPRGEMGQDDEYFALKEEILAGEKIQEKVKDVLDTTEQAWVVKSIKYRKDKQGETARGRLIRVIDKEQQALDKITHLQQLISQPPQP
jgi:hypothetical protein